MPIDQTNVLGGKQRLPKQGRNFWAAERLRREAETHEARQELLQHHRVAESLRKEAILGALHLQHLEYYLYCTEGLHFSASFTLLSVCLFFCYQSSCFISSLYDKFWARPILLYNIVGARPIHAHCILYSHLPSQQKCLRMRM